MNRKTQKWTTNLALYALVFWGGYIAFAIYAWRTT